MEICFQKQTLNVKPISKVTIQGQLNETVQTSEVIKVIWGQIEERIGKLCSDELVKSFTGIYKYTLHKGNKSKT